MFKKIKRWFKNLFCLPEESGFSVVRIIYDYDTIALWGILGEDYKKFCSKLDDKKKKKKGKK